MFAASRLQVGAVKTYSNFEMFNFFSLLKKFRNYFSTMYGALSSSPIFKHFWGKDFWSGVTGEHRKLTYVRVVLD